MAIIKGRGREHYEKARALSKYAKSMHHLRDEDIDKLYKQDKGEEIIDKAERYGGEEALSNLYFEPYTRRIFLYMDDKSRKNAAFKVIGAVKGSKIDELAERRKLKQRHVKSGGLEAKTGEAVEMAAMASGVIGLIMLGASAGGITGNVIGGRARDYLVSLELVLVIIGIIGAWLYLSDKEKK